MTTDQIHSQEWIDKIEELVREAESMSDPRARGVTIDLLRAVLAFHAAGLERVMDMIFEAGPPGEGIAQRIATDDLVSSMLLLHNLHPDDFETRVQRAVERLQNMFVSLGARLSLIALEPDTVRLRFESQRTWPGTQVKNSIEKAIFQAAPEITTVLLEGLQQAPPSGFVPINDLLAGLSR